MTYELTRAQQWLFLKLRASVGLTSVVADRIYEAPAPQGATLPYVLIDHRAGVDTSAGAVRVGTQMIFAIDVVIESGSNLALEPVYDAIDAALQGVTDISYRGILIDRIWRESNYANWGMEAGSVRRHIGALWRLFIRPQVLNP